MNPRQKNQIIILNKSLDDLKDNYPDLSKQNAYMTLAQLTPTNDELAKLARERPPAQEWFEGDMERPF